jgi:carbonic anhydrase
MCAICGNPSLNHAPGYSRRNFLKLFGGAGMALSLTGGALMAASPDDAPPKPQNVLSPEEALEKLKKGNKRYVEGLTKRHDFLAEREALVGGQNPYAGILSCADSRIAPEYAFDTGRGDVFVVRVAGNFADIDGIASFEYAVKFLGTPLLVVLGHDKCGAVSSTIGAVKDGAVLPGHLPELVNHIGPAVKTAMTEKGDLLDNSIRENVLLNVEALKTASPILSQYVDEKKVMVVGGVYKLDDGRIDWLS